MTRLTASEYLAQAKPKKRKYGNTPVTIDGIRFDSKAEGKFYCELKLREKAGEVSAVELQRRLAILGPKGEVICVAIPDFCFWDHVEDRFRAVDVKGGKATQTKEFRLKQKLAKAFLGIDIEVVER